MRGASSTKRVASDESRAPSWRWPITVSFTKIERQAKGQPEGNYGCNMRQDLAVADPGEVFKGVARGGLPENFSPKSPMREAFNLRAQSMASVVPLYRGRVA